MGKCGVCEVGIDENAGRGIAAAKQRRNESKLGLKIVAGDRRDFGRKIRKRLRCHEKGQKSGDYGRKDERWPRSPDLPQMKFEAMTKEEGEDGEGAQLKKHDGAGMRKRESEVAAGEVKNGAGDY
jgi:hypothetical protein